VGGIAASFVNAVQIGLLLDDLYPEFFCNAEVYFFQARGNLSYQYLFSVVDTAYIVEPNIVS